MGQKEDGQEKESFLDRTWLGDDIDGVTQELDTSSINIHEQYLEKLSQKYNGQINNALLFFLPSEAEPIIFIDETEINVGRRDRKGRIEPELDLGSHDGAELGISRLHAKIIWDGSRYLIQDLNSTNHTWLNGQKMVPYHYYTIADGSTIQFAKLVTTAFIIKRNK